MLSNYFSFKGRLNRKPFWIMHLVLYAILFALAFVLFFMAGGASLAGGSPLSGTSMIVLLPVIALSIAMYVSILSLTVRRMHDRNHSGWWILAFFAALMVLGFVGGMFQGSGLVEGIIGLITVGVGIWWLVELGFLKGTVGPNNYGPDPISGSVADPQVFGEEKQL